MATKKPYTRRKIKIRAEFLNQRAAADWINDMETALICGVHWTTIWRWAELAYNGFPQPSRRGRKCTRWNRAAVEAWMAAGTEVAAAPKPGSKPASPAPVERKKRSAGQRRAA